jgi:hypothetical protein
MHVANAVCCMTPMLLAASCSPYTPNLLFMKPQKLLAAYYASIVFGLSGNSQFIMKLTPVTLLHSLVNASPFGGMQGAA